jgi:hypothetical protein
MAKSLVALTGLVLLSGATLVQPVLGADYPRAKRTYARGPQTVYCGCCGCLGVTYDYHRELRSTYGTKFDPRNFDQTEPYYYFGRVRAYPRFWVAPGPREAKYP